MGNGYTATGYGTGSKNQAMKVLERAERVEDQWLTAPKGVLRMVLLNGPPGVAKTTVSNQPARQCPYQNAVLDGDDLVMTYPGGIDRKRLDLIERNIVHCAEGYRQWGAQYCFCSWIVAQQHRLDMLEKKLRAQKVHVRFMALDAPIDVLVDRMMNRSDTRFAATGDNSAYLSGLRKRIRHLGHCQILDTTGRHFTDVANAAARYIREPDFWE